MHIRDKILLDYNGLINEGPITIVAYGDSIGRNKKQVQVFFSDKLPQ